MFCEMMKLQTFKMKSFFHFPTWRRVCVCVCHSSYCQDFMWRKGESLRWNAGAKKRIESALNMCTFSGLAIKTLKRQSLMTWSNAGSGKFQVMFTHVCQLFLPEVIRQVAKWNAPLPWIKWCRLWFEQCWKCSGEMCHVCARNSRNWRTQVQTDGRAGALQTRGDRRGSEPVKRSKASKQIQSGRRWQSRTGSNPKKTGTQGGKKAGTGDTS